MKIVHIAYYYGLNHTGGACIAATRIHNALCAAGCESHYVCVHQMESGPNVYELPRKRTLSRFVYFLFTKCFRGIWRLTPYRQSACMHIVPLFGLDRLLNELQPDVVHVQWINPDVMSFRQLRAIKYPVVFHLHDIWMLNAIDPYPAEDKRYRDGFEKRNSTMLERWLFSRKLKTVKSLGAAFVGPSQWICGVCSESIIGNGAMIRCIPYLYDKRFRYDADLRNSHDRFVVLFGCYRGRANQIKGWSDFWDSVKLLPQSIRDLMQVNVFGEEFTDYDELGVKLHCLGQIRDPLKMVYECHQADISVLPSRQDNAPSTKFEALFCGLPVIAFRRTGCAEEIEHKVTGWIAPDANLQSFSDGIVFYFEQWENGGINHQLIANTIENKIEEGKMRRRMLSFYQEVIGSMAR